jgi:hypothetical protein
MKKKNAERQKRKTVEIEVVFFLSLWFFKTGSWYVVQAGPTLDPPAAASCVGSTGMHITFGLR